jgi:hypothetical protein
LSYVQYDLVEGSRGAARAVVDVYFGVGNCT